MLYKISVPSVVKDVEEIRILEWHGAPGERFERDELIVELETHKALVEVRAGQSGILRRILAGVGDWQTIGLPLAVFSDHPDEPLAEDPNTWADLAVEFEVT